VHGDTFKIPKGAVRLFESEPVRTRVLFIMEMFSGCNFIQKPIGYDGKKSYKRFEA
jgi:hypothetical protein